MLNIFRKIEIVFCIRSSNIITFISATRNQFLKFWNDYIVRTIFSLGNSVFIIYFFSSIKRKNYIIYLFIYIINFFIVQQNSVCCKSKSEIFIIFFFQTSCVFYSFFYNIPIHKRFPTEKIHF